jgi:transposase-like protein
MEESAEVVCPYCGAFNSVRVETSHHSVRFTSDCEVCCRPFEVLAVCEPGEILALEVTGQ